MRVSILQENLAKGLAVVNRAISSRPSMPVLANVLLTTEDTRLRLSATNLELGITMRINASVDTEGSITLPAKDIQERVNILPNERVDLELDARTNAVTIRCGGVKSEIKGIEAEQFPAVPEFDAEDGLRIPASIFRDMINQVAFAAAKEDNRPVLMGVLTRFEGTRFSMVSADGFRLALAEAQLENPVDKPVSLIIPARTLLELGRIIGPDDEFVYVSIPPGRSQVMFHLEEIDLVSQLIDGKFPDVDHLIPKSHSTSVSMRTDELLRACKYAEISARSANNTTRLRIRPGTPEGDQVIVSAQSQEKGDDEWPVASTIQGAGLDISFNVRFLIEFLNVTNEDYVVLEMTSASSPGVLKPNDQDGFVYVLMPMSVR
jgi:DNA polymerase III subunit beta